MTASAVDRLLVRGSVASRLNILIYHGVSETAETLGHCDVDRSRFEQHLQLLSRTFTVLPLGEAVSRLRAGTLPGRTACITFDDGYANNHGVAVPMLERYGLTATFFVATSYLDGGWMFNDVIIDALRRCESPVLDLSSQALGAYALDSIAARRDAAHSIISAVKYLSAAERTIRADAVREAAGVAPGESLMMTSEQVRDLARRGMEIGGHTHRHPILECEDDDSARRDIEEGKQRLEAIVGSPVKVFAYPNGRPGTDYSARHVAMVRAAGFDAAVSTAKGCAMTVDDRFQLPRFTPWDRVPEKFLCRLALARAGSQAERVT